MIDLVNCELGTIQVREIESKCVCIACRGFKTMWHRLYWNSQALITGGVYMVAEQHSCQKCGGIGFWTEPLTIFTPKLV